MVSLEASQFKANREQRKAIHRLNGFVLGAEYKRNAAMLAPVPRECVYHPVQVANLTSDENQTTEA